MLAVNVILLLLPAIAYSRISIRLSPGKTIEESFVSFSGSESALLTDLDRKTFKLDDRSINEDVYIYKGNRCSEIYFKAPTSVGDIFSRNDWVKVKVTLRPVRARIVGMHMKPVAVGQAEYINNHRKIEAMYSTSVTQTVEETVSHSWSTSGELSIGQEITYSCNIGVASAGGSTKLEYTSGWGKEKTESRTITLGTTSTIVATVPPGERVVATLTASKGTMEIEIEYEATIEDGYLLCYYNFDFKGTRKWAYSIYRLKNDAGHRSDLNAKISKEIVSIGFFTDVRLEISDGTTTTENPAGIIEVGAEEKS